MNPTNRPRGKAAVIRRALLAGSVATLAIIAVGTPATARPAKVPTTSTVAPTGVLPAGFASWAEVYRVQNQLNSAAVKILAAGGAGNASIVAAPQTRQVQVYWHGAVPASVTRMAKTLSVPVTFLPARYTHTQLVREAARVSHDPNVAQVSPKADGSGLNVRVTTATARLARQPGSMLASAAVPLSITTGARPQAMFSRQADIPPFWGGSRYNSPVGGCSNGFALFVPGSANVFEISAGHCGTNGNGVTIPGLAGTSGTILAKVQCRDTLAINYPSGVAARIYTGAFNSSSSAAVVGATPDFVGNLVETGGASSGEHFNIPVLAVDVFAAIGGIPCTSVGPLTVAGYSTATCAVAPGDSGGPAYSYSGANVLARGTITAGNLGTAVCPGVVANGGNTVLYAPLVRPAGDPQIGSLQFYGVGILT